MSVDHYRFTVGEFDCYSFSDGHFNYPLDVFFANADRPALERALRQRDLPLEHVTTPYACLLVDGGGQRVLVDMGAGILGPDEVHLFPSVDNSNSVAGRIVPNMRAVGIKPESIDKVIITHAHPDHVGGALDAQGNLHFPNARYFMAEAEWAFWMSEAASERVSANLLRIARKNLEPLQEQMSFVGHDFEIASGVRTVATYGHTPGHLAVSVTSNGERLLHISDVALHPLHLEHPAWYPVLDLDPAQARATRRRVMDRAAAQETLLFAHHFAPFPNMGYVRKVGKGWRWAPIDSHRRP
ncbi:MAG TPA: MBL fold metallo-hydrolase [Candidatus Sulfomarinibacteraceae bacterium]|nr:MBL fold metallo-hydrolase [Candidatus Sulfomarinibacteraceae bacterium]